MRLSTGRVHYFKDGEYGNQFLASLQETESKAHSMMSLLNVLGASFHNLTKEQSFREITALEISEVFVLLSTHTESIRSSLENINMSVDSNIIEALNKFNPSKHLEKCREMDLEEEDELRERGTNNAR